MSAGDATTDRCGIRWHRCATGTTSGRPPGIDRSLPVVVECLDDGGEASNLGHMLAGEPAQDGLPFRSHLYSGQPPVVGVGLTVDQPRSSRPIDQFADAVVAQHQVIGHVGDGRRTVEVAFDGEEELMLGRGESHVARRLLAPAQEAAQLFAEVEQPLIIGLFGRCHGLIQAGSHLPGSGLADQLCDHIRDLS